MQLEGLLLPTHLATEKFRHFLFLAVTVVDATFDHSLAWWFRRSSWTSRRKWFPEIPRRGPLPALRPTVPADTSGRDRFCDL